MSTAPAPAPKPVAGNEKRELDRPVFVTDSTEVRPVYLDTTIHRVLPAEVYILKWDGIKVAFTKKAKKFVLPKKIYGRSQAIRNRVIARYKKDGPQVGVLSIGLKGSGKSLLAETLGNDMIETHKLPVIMVETAIPLENLREVLKDVGPCMLYFDEFGKVFSHRERAEMLPLFSDTNSKGVLFCITANEDHEVNEFLLDRPGRLLYRIRYTGVDKEGLEEIFTDLKLSDILKEHLRNYVKIHVSVSYDVLLKLIEEIRDCVSETEIRDLMEVLNVPLLPVMGYKIVQATNGKGEVVAVNYQQFDNKERLLQAHMFDNGRRVKVIINIDTDVKEDGESTALFEKDGYVFSCSKKRVVPTTETLSEDGEEDPNQQRMMRRYFG